MKSPGDFFDIAAAPWTAPGGRMFLSPKFLKAKALFLGKGKCQGQFLFSFQKLPAKKERLLGHLREIDDHHRKPSQSKICLSVLLPFAWISAAGSLQNGSDIWVPICTRPSAHLKGFALKVFWEKFNPLRNLKGSKQPSTTQK